MQTRVYSNPHKGTWTQTNVNEYSLMPSFHHSVAVLPLPFLRSVLPFRCTIAVLLFRSYRCRCGWEWKCWKRLSVYIGMKRPERWLVVRLRQNGKNRIRTEWWLRCNGRWQWQWRNGIFHVGNGRMATEWWKPGNMSKEVRGWCHKCCYWCKNNNVKTVKVHIILTTLPYEISTDLSAKYLTNTIYEARDTTIAYAKPTYPVRKPEIHKQYENYQPQW